MRRALWLVAAVMALTAFIGSSVKATPAFVGNCVNPEEVKELFARHGDVQQLGPWLSEEIQARHRNRGIDWASRTIVMTGIPADQTVVATICGTLQPGQTNATPAQDEKKLYPNGKPGHWCGYGGPGTTIAVPGYQDGVTGTPRISVNRGSVCNDFSQSWFTNYQADRASITFVNGAETYLYGFVWAYVRPTTSK